MTWIFRTSALLNLALLVVAALVLRPSRPEHGNAKLAAEKLPEPTSGNATTAPTESFPFADAKEIYVTNTFRWAALEATNYSDFVANLRAVHCPEQTIRDIIWSDAERRYARLEDQSVDSLPFWLAGRARAEASRQARTNRTAAKVQLIHEVNQLLGLEWSPEESQTHKPEIQAIARIIVGPATEAEYIQIFHWFLGSMQQSQLFRETREHLLLRADVQEWSQTVADRLALLKQALAPATFEEFQARSAFMEEAIDDKTLHFLSLEVSPNELRQLCLLKTQELGWLEEPFDLNRHRSEPEQASRRLSFVTAAQAVLSPDHYAEFLRVQDNDYRELLEVTLESNLSRTVARQVYEIRQLAAEEFSRLRAEADNPAAIEAAAELQLTTAASVRKLLGEETFKNYTAHNGKWVNDLGKL